MTKVKINDNEYIATISGSLRDTSWENRDTKTIEFYGILTASEVADLFSEGASWSIINEYDVQTQQLDDEGNPVLDADGNPVMVAETKREEYDNSEYSMAGAVTDYRDGVVSVKMAKLTELEQFIEDMYKEEE